MPARTPCTVRGKTYPSIAAAARALGVTTSALWQRIERGTQDRAGAPRGKPVEARGVRYASTKEAAAALGVRPGVIRAYICRGVPGFCRPRD